MPRRAVIDIGTNSVRLLVADVPDGARASPPFRLHPARTERPLPARPARLSEAGLARASRRGPARASAPRAVEQRLIITRLGEGLGTSGAIRPAAAKRTAAAVDEFIETASAAGAGPPILVATHPLRVARNPDELLSRLRFPVRILSGDEEARLGFHGALAGIGSLRSDARVLVVDIGGGSVELTCGDRHRIENNLSLPIGAVVLTEQFVSHDPPLRREIAAVDEALTRTLKSPLERISRPVRGMSQKVPLRVIGVGGTITTMAALDQRLDPYDPDRVHGYRLTRGAVQRITRRLLAQTVAARRDLPGLQPERADIIAAGALVLRHLLVELDSRQITVSETDLLWALVLGG
ncbi:MAG TPA: Ppx/GppA family phosphatase [bacterium]|nr:Ppx/GppA family phosphatase [bacterium]